MDAEEVSKRCVLFKNVPIDTTESQFRQWLDGGQNAAFTNAYSEVHRHVEDEQDIRWIVLFEHENDAINCIKTSQFEVQTQDNEVVKLVPDYCSECIIPDKWLKIPEGWVTIDEPDSQPFSLIQDVRFMPSNASSITSEDLFRDRSMSEGPINICVTDEENRISSNEMFGSGKTQPVFSSSTTSSAMFGSGGHTSGSLGFGEEISGASNKVQSLADSEEAGIDLKQSNEDFKKSDVTIKTDKVTVEHSGSLKSKDTSDKSKSKDAEEPQLRQKENTSNQRQGIYTSEKRNSSEPNVQNAPKGMQGKDTSEKRNSSEPNVQNVFPGYPYPQSHFSNAPTPEAIAQYYHYTAQLNQLYGTADAPRQSYMPYGILPRPSSPMAPLSGPQGQTPSQFVYVPVALPTMPGAMGGPMYMPFPIGVPGAMPGAMPDGMPGMYYQYGQTCMAPQPEQKMHANSNGPGSQRETPRKDEEKEMSKNDNLSGDNTYITPMNETRPPASVDLRLPRNSSVKSTDSVDRHGYTKKEVRVPQELKRGDTVELDEGGYVVLSDIERQKSTENYDDGHIYDSINEETLAGDLTMRAIRKKTQSINEPPAPPPVRLRKRSPSMPSKFSHPKTTPEPETTSKRHGLTIIDDSKEDDYMMLGKTIKVEGVPNYASEDMIKLFIERQEVSCNAEVINVKVCPEKHEAVVDLKYSSGVERILKKQESRPDVFKLGNRQVRISVYTPPPLDPTKVFISGMKDETSKDNLQNFIEVCCGRIPTTIEFGLTPGTALLIFDTPPEFETFKEKLKHRSLEGQSLDIFKVEVTKSVKVKGYDPELSHDALLYYFENTKRSGGGEVDRVEYQEENNVHIVHFLKLEDAVNVCKRVTHEVSGAEITVCLYYSCLDLAPEFKVTIPDPLEIMHLDPYIIRFLSKSSPYKMKFEMQLKKTCLAGVVWPTDKDEPLRLVCSADPRERGLRDKLNKWHDKCKQEVDIICADLVVNEEIHVAKEVWNGVHERLRDITFPDADMVMIHVKREDFLIVVFGLRQSVEAISKTISDIVSELEEKLTADHQTITKSKLLKTYQAALLRYIKFAEKSTSSSLSVAMTDRQIEFNGSKATVDECIHKMYQRLKEFAHRPVSGYTKAAKDLLFQKETRNYIKEMVNKKRLLLVWDVIRGCDLVLYSKTEKDLDEAVNIFLKSLMQTTIPLDASMQSLTRNPDWEAHLVQMRNNHEYTGLMNIEMKLGEICIVGVNIVFQKVYDDVMKFFDLHADISEFVKVETGRFLYIFRNKKDELERIEKQYSSLSVRIERVDKHNRKGFKVHGKKDGCRLAISRIQQVVDNITYKDVIIAKPGFKEFIQHVEGKQELHNIEMKENCILLPEVSDFNESPLSSGNDMPKEAASCKMGRCSISVMEGDITCLTADMIVNPSFPSLAHNIGLGSAIIDKGGFEIQKQCHEHVRKYSPLGDAEIFISKAGKLPSKRVVHVALPTWKGGNSNERSLLRMAVEHCIKGAVDSKAKTLALPVIGAGMFAYPVDVAAKNIVEMIHRYGVEKGPSSIERIYLCEKRSENVQAFIDALKGKVGSTELVVYKDSGSSGGSASSTSSGGSIEDYHGQCPTVAIVEGELAKQTVDVIVNSTNQNLDLKVGLVSRGLLRAGGEVIQSECYDRYPEGINIGDVAKTTGGALKCKQIFHGILQKWDQGQGPSENVMATFIQRCLGEADKRQMKSIAFPALGTGKLEFPPDTVADLMFKCVGSFQSSYLKEVRLVVWQGDAPTVKAFHDADKRFQKEQRIRMPRPFSEIYRPSEHVVHSPGKEFKTTIENVTMEILQGDITKQKTGAIVNSVLKDLNLSNGRVSKAILDAGGSVIQTECLKAANKQRMDKEGVIFTGPGKLLCQRIIHMKAKNTNQGWEKMICRCLSEVENLGLNSVTFPALGTGGKGCTPESIAKLMMSAFRQYITSKEFRRCLKSIRIVIYETHMLEIFVKSVSENPQPSSRVMEMFRPKTQSISQIKIHVYIDSQSHLENVKTKLEDLYSEETIQLTGTVLEKLDYKLLESSMIRKTSMSRHVDINLKRGYIAMQGYGSGVQTTKRDIQGHLNKLEKGYMIDRLSTSVTLPKSWTKMSINDPLKIEVLSTRCDEYVRLQRKFCSEVGVRNIVKIERIQNPTLYVQYYASKCQMDQTNKGSPFPVERCLWHGTSGDATDSINNTGFNRNFNSGASHGVGVYFAVRATTSLSYCKPDGKGLNHMYYCHVLTGDTCIGSHGIRNPPQKLSRQSSVTYDSTTDDLQSPNFFVIFHDAKAYPSYHIEFN